MTIADATQPFLSVDGRPCTSIRLTVPYVGPWEAVVSVQDESPLPVGRVRIVFGGLTLTGTVEAEANGTQTLERRARIVAGGGGWRTVLRPRAYHNDAGVRAQLVCSDAARECGEVLGAFVPGRERIGIDYARSAGPASRALTDAIGGGVAWWLDYDGVTNVGARQAGEPDASAYQVLTFDPAERIATFTANDPSTIRVGDTLTQGLDVPATVRELELRGQGGTVTCTAWLGGDAQDPGRLAGLLAAITARLTDSRLYGVYRYRVVVQRSDGRLDLQPVTNTNMPNLTYVTPWPGVAGTHATLAAGAQVLVQFVDGDRTQPIVAMLAASPAPIALTLGGASGPPAARQGDSVQVTLPPSMPFAMTVGAVVTSGTITFTPNTVDGVVTSGSGVVAIA